MTNSNSLLQTINQKELEIKHRVEEAQQRTETLIQAAREEAEQTVLRAGREARLEAETQYQQEIKETCKQAEAIVAQACEQAADLRQKALARREDAADQIMTLVLPPVPDSRVESVDVTDR